jgi:ubiquinone/menaquinone biosynthesis C-methylase UbiE
VIEPSEYTHWRGTYLGALTERIEEAAIFDFAGDVRGKHLLDLGCGDGTYSIAASQRGALVVGFDVSEAMLKAARHRATVANAYVEWCRASAEAIPYNSETFDIVLAVTILCFIGEPLQVLREVHRVLRPGGAFVIGELGKYSSWALWRRVRGWLGSARWKEAHFWSLCELRRLLEQAGFRVTASRACVYYPPFGLAAQVVGEHDDAFSFLGQFGAAFLAARGEKS